MSRTAHRSLVAVATALVFLFGHGCGEPEGESGPAISCSDVSGTWHVAIDYASMTIRQDWSIAQTGCSLVMTGGPPDPGGLGLDGTPRNGTAWENSFGARWDRTSGPCPVQCSFDATLSGTTFSGSIFWIESPCNGYPGNSGSVPVAGAR